MKLYILDYAFMALNIGLPRYIALHSLLALYSNKPGHNVIIQLSPVYAFLISRLFSGYTLVVTLITILL